MAKKDDYYFGGAVPREIQEKLEVCRDRGMQNKTIARKMAHLFLSLPEEMQNKIYLSTIDENFDPKDKAIADLLSAIDDVVVGYILARLPNSVKLVESFAAAQQHKQAQEHKRSPHKTKDGTVSG